MYTLTFYGALLVLACFSLAQKDGKEVPDELLIEEERQPSELKDSKRELSRREKAFDPTCIVWARREPCTSKKRSTYIKPKLTKKDDRFKDDLPKLSVPPSKYEYWAKRLQRGQNNEERRDKKYFNNDESQDFTMEELRKRKRAWRRKNQ